ncbi:MAG TPA: HDOD domain-containing protein [Planctomycetes bacterium]|nr:HDOD domain-containing protein [Planctomycetota bacterium]HIL53267.1 HDOD domain-containing protein [Planctomycetota bacterium]
MDSIGRGTGGDSKLPCALRTKRLPSRFCTSNKARARSREAVQKSHEHLPRQTTDPRQPQHPDPAGGCAGDLPAGGQPQIRNGRNRRSDRPRRAPSGQGPAHRRQRLLRLARALSLHRTGLLGLGVRVLRNVVTQAAVIQQFHHLQSIPGFSIDELWRHGILTAQACREFARHSQGCGALTPDEFYTCGLLHDLGKIVMLDSLGEDYVEVHQEAESSGDRLHQLEELRFGFNHTDVGALVALRWNLPTAAASAIQYHHGPRQCLEDDPVVTLVANANLVAHRVAAGNMEAAELTLDEETAQFLGLDIDDVAGIMATVQASMADIVV